MPKKKKAVKKKVKLNPKGLLRDVVKRRKKQRDILKQISK